MKTTTLLLTFSLIAIGCGGTANSPSGDDTHNSAGTSGGTTGGGTSSGSTTSGGTTGGGTTSGGTTGGDPSPAPTMSSPDGPSILSFGTDVGRITTSETVRFVAVVTHPAGLDKLVGGKLVDASGQINYGALIATTQGSYQIDLSWDQINKTAPINFDAEINRAFVAQFYDQAGNVSTTSVLVGLYCQDHLAACNGVCGVDVSTDKNNCGTCGNKLPDGFICYQGKIDCEAATYCDGKCVDTQNDPNNCGGCGVVVAAPQVCENGHAKCGLWSGGDTYCAATNTCVDAKTDPNNCGACGLVVPPGSTCVGGVPVCSSGVYCGATNSCEAPGQDVNNCGACGHVCVAPAGTTPSCQNSVCVYDAVVSTPGTTCNDYCRTKGLECTFSGGKAFYTNHDPINLTCTDVPSASIGAGESFTSAECTCA